MGERAATEAPAVQAATTLRDHVIVCGLGHVGRRVVELLARVGEPLAIITRALDDDLQRALAARFPLLEGDARDDRLLLSAGIERARAVLAVTDDDSANVSIALDAGRLHPGIAIVARLFDQRLAAQLERSLGVRRVLSTSALSAPAFVARALGGNVLGTFSVADRDGQVERAWVDATGPLRDAWRGWHQGPVAVLALCRAGEARVAPSGDAPVLPGDELILARLSPPGGFGEGVKRRAPRGSLLALLLGLRDWWRDTPRLMRLLLALLLLVGLGSVAVFELALGLSPLDSLHLVATTLTTADYGAVSLLRGPAWLKAYAALLMLAGAVLFALFFGIITDLLLRTRLADVLARGRARQTDHVVLAGLGTIGYRILCELQRRGESVVAIERDESGEFLGTARVLAPVVVGNARAEETLRRANVQRAKAVVAATDDDLANLSIALAAKQTRPEARVVLRIFDDVLAKRIEAGIALEGVLSTSAVAAPTFVGAALCPQALAGFVLNDRLVVITLRDGAGPSQQGEDHPLFLRRCGQSEFLPCEDEPEAAAGDVVLGVRVYPLRDEGA